MSKTKKPNNVHNTALEPEQDALLSEFVSDEIDKLVNEEVEAVIDPLAGRKAQQLEKEMMKKLCDKEAYDIIYNKAMKSYELVVIKYASDTDVAYVDRKERLDSDQVLAIDKLNRKLDIKLLNERH